MNKSRYVPLRIPEQLYKDLEAASVHCGSISEVIRRRCKELPIVDFKAAKGLILALNEIYREMGYIGNNINQVAHQMNANAISGSLDPQVVKSFNELLAAYLESRKDLSVKMDIIMAELPS